MKLEELAAERDELRMKDRVWHCVIEFLERHVENEELVLLTDDKRVIPKEIIQLVIDECDGVADIGRRRIEVIEKMEVSDVGERRTTARAATDDELRAAVSREPDRSSSKHAHRGSGDGVRGRKRKK